MTLAITAQSKAISRTLQEIAGENSLVGYELRQEENAILLLHNGTVQERFNFPLRPQTIAQALSQLHTNNHLANGWQFDATARKLKRQSANFALTEKETLLLEALLDAFPAACGRDELLKNVWAMQPDIETHTLETHVYRLRQKLSELEPRPCDILTTDAGYQLTV